MQGNDFQLHKDIKKVVIALLVIIVLISVLTIWNTKALHNTMQKQTDEYLDRIIDEAADSVDERVFKKTKELLRIATKSIQNRTSQEQTELLRQLQVQINFSSFLLFDTDGKLLSGTVQRHTIYPIEQEMFQRATKGEEIVDYFPQHQLLAYMMPMEENRTVTGVLVGFRSMEDIQRLLKDKSFSGKDSSAIIDEYGCVIIPPDNTELFVELKNAFEKLEQSGDTKKADLMQADLKNSKSNEIRMKLDSGTAIVRYTYMQNCNWYLLTVVPSDILSKETKLFVTIDNWMIAITIIGFAVIFALVLVILGKYQKKIEHMAFVDNVTQGYSMIRFQKDVVKKIAQKPLGTYALISLNIQNFKLINDIYGSEAGNATLRYVYHMLYKAIDKETEMIARGSADNFYLLLCFENEKNMQKRLKNMVKDINSFNDGKIEPYYLTINCGVFVIEEEGLNLITIQDRANVARKNVVNNYHLYHIKFFDKADREQLLLEKELTVLMEIALIHEEFKIYLQPKVVLRQDRKVAGAEALVRWISPSKGFIYPSHFIPVFEKNGFIRKLDLYMFDSTCRILERWQKEGRELIPISVNFSKQNLKQPNFMEQFKKIFQNYDIPANLIELEITESVMVEDIENLARVIHEIHEIGFQCSLDDFGSGYSSLWALRNLKVDTLKLDRGFFGEEEDKRGESVIETIIDLSKRLDMETVAEGIESMEQVEMLEKLGCTKIQGYVFSKPCPVEEFESFAYERKKLKKI